jgi:hypothetical protein
MDRQEHSLRDSLIVLGNDADKASLPYLLVGGNAIIHYGVPRFTRDIDLLLPESAVGQWRAFLESRGWACFHATAAFLQFDGKEAGLPPVDLMVVDESTWQSLLAAAVRAPLAGGFSALLPSPLHLVAMKLQAYRGQHRARREQDWADLRHLVDHHLTELPLADLRTFVVRHGGPPAWDRLERELSREQ